MSQKATEFTELNTPLLPSPIAPRQPMWPLALASDILTETGRGQEHERGRKQHQDICSTMMGSLLALAVSVSAHLAPRPVGPAVRAQGAGELRLAHRYPLRELTYAAEASGRGMLVFGMGQGVLVLSGPDADEVAPGVYVLHLDVLQVTTMQSVHGDCRLSLAGGGRIYRALDCKGSVLSTGERFSLVWRGQNAPAEPVP